MGPGVFFAGSLSIGYLIPHTLFLATRSWPAYSSRAMPYSPIELCAAAMTAVQVICKNDKPGSPAGTPRSDSIDLLARELLRNSGPEAPVWANDMARRVAYEWVKCAAYCAADTTTLMELFEAHGPRAFAGNSSPGPTREQLEGAIAPLRTQAALFASVFGATTHLRDSCFTGPEVLQCIWDEVVRLGLTNDSLPRAEARPSDAQSGPIGELRGRYSPAAICGAAITTVYIMPPHVTPYHNSGDSKSALNDAVEQLTQEFIRETRPDAPALVRAIAREAAVGWFDPPSGRGASYENLMADFRSYAPGQYRFDPSANYVRSPEKLQRILGVWDGQAPRAPQAGSISNALARVNEQVEDAVGLFQAKVEMLASMIDVALVPGDDVPGVLRRILDAAVRLGLPSDSSLPAPAPETSRSRTRP